MVTVDAVLEKNLKKITPPPGEQKETKKVLDEVLKATEKVIKPLGLSFVLAGSFLRDTWMPHKKEFDVFILFPESLPKEALEEKGLKIGKKIVSNLGGSHRIAYAEHPYVRGKVKGYDVDFVPCYKIKSTKDMKSSVDRTPFHNLWLAKYYPGKLSEEVRLLKQFSKNLGFYGSDAKTEGFSGYLCELLIVHYRDFRDFLKAASEWKAGKVFIDPEGHHKGKEQEILNKFRGQPLVVIDPVDPERNVAAVLSPGNFAKVVKASRDFLKNPLEDFFFRKKTKPDLKLLESTMKKRQTKFLAVVFKTPDIIEDILYHQLRKTARRLKDILEENEFLVLGYDVWSGKDTLILLEMEVWSLPKIRKLRGPEIFAEKHAKEFKNKYQKGRLWVENNYWVAEVPRKFLMAEDKLQDSLKASAKNLKDKGIASYAAESISKKFQILKDKEILAFAKKNPDFAEFLQEYFGKKY